MCSLVLEFTLPCLHMHIGRPSPYMRPDHCVLLRQLGGKPDLIIGNYSDGNLVSSLLSHHLNTTQCTIAHALEKTKYPVCMTGQSCSAVLCPPAASSRSTKHQHGGGTEE